VKEGKERIFGEGWCSCGIYKVPSAADISIWDVEGGVERFKTINFECVSFVRNIFTSTR
jgi:hypothetical protein